MSLLELSPEAARLRRVAKACAAGEMSRSEYRRARRRLVAEFMGVEDSVTQITLSGFDSDVTQRRVLASELPAEDTVQGGAPWLWVGALALALLAASFPIIS